MNGRKSFVDILQNTAIIIFALKRQYDSRGRLVKKELIPAMNNQNTTPLFDALVEYNRRKPAYFRVPGHRYEKGINPILREAVGDAIFSFDLT